MRSFRGGAIPRREYGPVEKQYCHVIYAVITIRERTGGSRDEATVLARVWIEAWSRADIAKKTSIDDRVVDRSERNVAAAEGMDVRGMKCRHYTGGMA
jgi:hypothetical protein